MTRKHFIALANALYAQKPTCGNKARLKQWESCTEAVASVCKMLGPAFNKYAWLKAVNGKPANISGKWYYPKQEASPSPMSIAAVLSYQQQATQQQVKAAAGAPAILVGTIDDMIVPF